MRNLVRRLATLSWLSRLVGTLAGLLAWAAYGQRFLPPALDAGFGLAMEARLVWDALVTVAAMVALGDPVLVPFLGVALACEAAATVGVANHPHALWLAGPVVGEGASVGAWLVAALYRWLPASKGSSPRPDLRRLWREGITPRQLWAGLKMSRWLGDATLARYQGDPATAIRYSRYALDAAIAGGSRNQRKRARLLLASLIRDTGRFEDAVDALLEPDEPRAQGWVWLAAGLHQLGRHEEALPWAERAAAEAAPGRDAAVAWLALADVRWALQRDDVEAAFDAARAALGDVDAPRIRAAIAVSHAKSLSSSDPARALALLEGVQAGQFVGRAATLRGMALTRLHRWAEAADAFQRAFQANEGAFQAFMVAELCAERLADPVRAERAAQIAIGAAGTEGDVVLEVKSRRTLARVLRRQGRAREGAAALREALAVLDRGVPPRRAPDIPVLQPHELALGAFAAWHGRLERRPRTPSRTLRVELLDALAICLRDAGDPEAVAVADSAAELAGKLLTRHGSAEDVVRQEATSRLWRACVRCRAGKRDPAALEGLSAADFTSAIQPSYAEIAACLARPSGSCAAPVRQEPEQPSSVTS